MILFDLDGTLLDDDAATASGLDALHARYGTRIRRPRDQLARYWLELIDHYFPRYLSGEMTMQEQRRLRIRAVLDVDSTPIPDDEADAIHAVYIEGYERGWSCFADVFPVLEQLSHIPLGIITNGNKEQQRKKLERTGLARLFTTIITSDEFGCAKPDARIFHEACRRGGISPSEAIFVGDNVNADIEGSRGAGLYPIWIRRPGDDRYPRQSDVTTIETLHDLPAALASLGRYDFGANGSLSAKTK